MATSWIANFQTLRHRLLRCLHRKLSASSGTAASDEHTPVGAIGEQLASKFLKRLGYRILKTGFTVRQGEIDIIALDKRVVVFVEVKTWTRTGQGGPSDAVDDRKQKRITSAALQYLKQNRLLETPARFDVVQVILETESGEPEIRHFQNAFEASGTYQMFS